MTQKQLAELAKMAQPRISAMERPGAATFNIETLVRLASAFKIGLKVEFVPFSEMLQWENNYSQDNFDVMRINEDTAFLNPATVPAQLSIPAVTNSSSWSPVAFYRPAETVSPFHARLSSSIASFSILENLDLLKGVPVSQMKPARVNIDRDRVAIDLLIAHQEQEKYADA